MDNFDTAEKGASLLEVLISSSILAIIVFFSGHAVLNFSKISYKKKGQLSQLSIKNYLNQNVSCAKTLQNTSFACTLDDYLEVWKNDELLIKYPEGSDFSKVGDHQLRATCKSCASCASGFEIYIESRIIGKNNEPKSTWKNLYKKVPFSCTFELWDSFNI